MKRELNLVLHSEGNVYSVSACQLKHYLATPLNCQNIHDVTSVPHFIFGTN